MSKGTSMSEEKAKRIVIGATAAGVLLVIVLVVILVVQFVQMGVRQRKLDEIKTAQETYRQKLESRERDLEWYESWFGMYNEALKQGYN